MKIFFAVLFLTQIVSAAEFNHVTLPDEDTAMGKKIVLNGIGLRDVTKAFMDFDVYVGGLYLEKKSDDASAILASNEIKEYKMHFLRKVTAKQSRESWDESYERNCKGDRKTLTNPKMVEDCDAVKAPLEEFQKLFSDVQSDQVVDYIFSPKEVVMKVDGKEAGKVVNGNLSRFLLNALLGDRPISDVLKKRLLGTKIN